MAVADDLTAHFLLALEVLHAARVQRIAHLVHHGAVTVTFSVFGHTSRSNDCVLLVLGDDLLRLDSVLL